MRLKAALRLLNPLYRWGQQLDRRWTKSVALPFPVISVGNIASGGRAKSPFVIYLARELLTRGYYPIVLTRGYGRRANFPVWLEREKFPPQLNGVEDTGDEAMEIHLETRATVLISGHRLKNATNYLRAREAHLRREGQRPIFILDDGFQHWRIQRQMDLVLTAPPDYTDETLPAGPLREPVSALGRAHLVWEQGKDFFKVTELQYVPQRPALLLTTRAPDAGYLEFFREKKIALEVRSLGDHATLAKMRAALARSPCRDILVGGKEAVKLLAPAEFLELRRQGIFRLADGRTLHYVGLRLKLVQEDVLWRIFAQRLGSSAL